MSNPRADSVYRRAMMWPIFVKEFRQLRLTRAIALLAGPLFCTMLTFAVDAGNKGTLGFSMLAGYDHQTLVTQLMPVGLVALWVLLGMLLSVQAFVSPHGAALEPFLLERPVKRSTVWWARLRGALLSAALIALLHFGIWVLFVLARTSFPEVHEGGWLRAFTLGLIGLLVGVLTGAWSGVVSGEVPRGILVGVILLVAPAGLAQMMGGLFPFAVYWGVPYFYWAALLFWFLLAVGSYRAACFGEPAGGGRLRRAVKPAVIGLVVSLVAFFASADTIVRKTALSHWSFSRGSVHDEGFLIGDGAVWWIDVEEASIRRFLAPPVLATAMSDDGSRLAVVHLAGRFGRLRRAPVLDILDLDGRRVRRLELSGGDFVPYRTDLVWAGDRIYYLHGLAEGIHHGLVVDPESGERRTLDLPGFASQRWALLKPRDDSSRIFLIDRDKGVLLAMETDDPSARFERIFTLAENEWFSPSPISPRGTRVALLGLMPTADGDRGSCFVALDGAQRRACGSSGAVHFWIDENRAVFRRNWKHSIYVEFDTTTGFIREREFGAGTPLVPAPDGQRAVSGGHGDIVYWSFKDGFPERSRTLTEGLEKDPGPSEIRWANPSTLFVHGEEGTYLLTPPERRWKRISGRLPDLHSRYNRVRRR